MRFCKQKTAYEKRSKNGSSDRCASDLVLRVGGGEEPPQARIVGAHGEDVAELVDEVGDKGSLRSGEVQLVAAGARALDPAPGGEDAHQASCCIVAQRPCSWSRNTCISQVSRGPLATTARPSVCTCIISRSAFSFG